MFYFKISCFAYSRDYIKTHGYIKLKSPDIGVCRFYSMPDFLHSNGVFRLHDSCITAGFNFYYYKLIVFGCHNVKFEMSFPPVPMTNDILILFQIGYGGIFSGFS